MVEWISENTCEVSGNTGACPDGWPLGGVGDSVENWGLVLEPIEGVKGSEGTEYVLGVKGEWVSKEEVWSFFDRNSSKGIEPALVSLLKLLRESLVGLERSVGHFANYTQRWWDDHWYKECWNFTIIVVFETTEVGWPSRVSFSQEGNFGSNIKESGGKYSLGSASESCLIRFKIDCLSEENSGLSQICGWFIMSQHQLCVLNKVIEILLDTACEKSNSDTLNTNYLPYLVGSSSWEWNRERGPTW